MELFGLYPAIFNGATTLNLQHVESVEPALNIEEMTISGGGSVDRLYESTNQTDPKWKLMTRDLLAVLGKVSPVSGFACPTGSKFQYRKHLSGSDFDTGSVNYTVTTPLGFLYIEEFGAKQGDKEAADMSLQYQALYDGTTAPCTFNASQALTSTVAITGTHVLGPVDFEGVSGGLVGVQSTRVKPGITTEIKYENGEIWPRSCRIKERRPIIEIECLNVGIAATLTMNKLYPMTTGCTAFFTRTVSGSGRVGVGTTSHLSVTAATGSYKLTGFTTGKDGNTLAKIEVRPTGVLTYSTAAAIVIPS